MDLKKGAILLCFLERDCLSELCRVTGECARQSVVRVPSFCECIPSFSCWQTLRSGASVIRGCHHLCVEECGSSLLSLSSLGPVGEGESQFVAGKIQACLEVARLCGLSSLHFHHQKARHPPGTVGGTVTPLPTGLTHCYVMWQEAERSMLLWLLVPSLFCVLSLWNAGGSPCLSFLSGNNLTDMPRGRLPAASRTCQVDDHCFMSKLTQRLLPLLLSESCVWAWSTDR